MGFENLERISDPKLMAESCAEAILDMRNDKKLELSVLVEELDFLQFQVLEIPNYDEDQRIAVSNDYLRGIYEELVDALEVDHPQFLWRNGLIFSQSGDSCSIKLDVAQLSEEA